MLSPAIIAWLAFSLCAVLIGYSGTKLSRYGDVIADKTGLGGACIINLTMIVILDLLRRGESVYTRVSQGHILSAGFGIIMAGFVGLTFCLRSTAMPCRCVISASTAHC